jgi:hypothetical protein
LGPAHDVGRALCYWILKGNGQVLARTTVNTITAEDVKLNVQHAAIIAANDKRSRVVLVTADSLQVSGEG